MPPGSSARCAQSRRGGGRAPQGGQEQGQGWSPGGRQPGAPTVTPWSQQCRHPGPEVWKQHGGGDPSPQLTSEEARLAAPARPRSGTQQKQEHNQIQKTHTENAQDSQVKGHQEHQHLTAAQNLKIGRAHV